MTQNHRPCPTCGGTGIAPNSIASTLDAPGRIQTNAASTSKRAAGLNAPLPRFGTQRHECLLALDQRGPLTAAAVSRAIGTSRNQAATRLGELRDGGLVAYCRDPESGDLLTASTGPADEGLVQTITALGREAITRITPRKGIKP
jgi:hypothetical protein